MREQAKNFAIAALILLIAWAISFMAIITAFPPP
jgi:hypothetical protein